MVKLVFIKIQHHFKLERWSWNSILRILFSCCFVFPQPAAEGWTIRNCLCACCVQSCSHVWTRPQSVSACRNAGSRHLPAAPPHLNLHCTTPPPPPVFHTRNMLRWRIIMQKEVWGETRARKNKLLKRITLTSASTVAHFYSFCKLLVYVKQNHRWKSLWSPRRSYWHHKSWLPRPEMALKCNKRLTIKKKPEPVFVWKALHSFLQWFRVYR